MDMSFNEEWLVQSSSYSDVMNSTVLPWLKNKASSSVVSGYDGHPLHCETYQAEKPVATVFFVHGFTENTVKYAELIWSALHLGFSVVIYDQRGHGLSWRDPGVSHHSVTHIDHFEDYVRDLRIICDACRGIMPEPWFVFAHSMGGAVASLFLEQEKNVFRAAVLSSPMIAPDTGGVPASVASALAFLAGIIGKGKNNPFFLRPYSGPEDFSTSCATDPSRFFWYDSLKASEPVYQNSVPSYRWSYESIQVTRKILASGAPEKINCPVLLFSAGMDHSVRNGPQAEFVRRIPGGIHVAEPQARHEIYRSVNEVLFPWWHKVIAFYRKNVTPCGSEGDGQ